MRLRIALALALVGVLGTGAPDASASFEGIRIREVFFGSAIRPNAEYVELQMFAPGQNLVAGHTVRVFDSEGKFVADTVFAADVANGVDQSTLLVATPDAESMFGVAADAQMTQAQTLDPSGGAVCWAGVDCVSWGNFAGRAPSPTGTPALAVPEGLALRRTIEPSCPTLLEQGDDRDNSIIDFALATPNPRPNGAVPIETRCQAEEPPNPPKPGPPIPDPAPPPPPATNLLRMPARRALDRTPTFRFGSDQANSSFECAIDRQRFRPCRSPFTIKQLAFGRHRFVVRARNGAGQNDPTPASYTFKVVPASER